MPFKNSYNEQIADKMHNILQKKIDHENLHTDNLDGGSGYAMASHLDLGFGPKMLGATSTSKPATIPVEDMLRNLPSMKASNEDLEGGKKKPKAKAKTAVKKKGKGLSAGGLSAGGLSAGGLSAGKKPRKKTMKGGDFHDILDGVSHIASTAKDVAEAVAPVASVVAPLLALGKPKRKSRKGAGVSLHNPSREPYREGGQSDIPDGPLVQTAPTANKGASFDKPVEKNQMPGVGNIGSGKKKRPLSDKMKRRNELIKKIMKEDKCSLIDASKKIAAEKMAY